MSALNIREMRANMGRLDELVAEEGELVISRRGQPIARILPMAAHRQYPGNADLRIDKTPGLITRYPKDSLLTGRHIGVIEK